MKAFLRKTVRSMAHWPLVGRFVRIGVAVIRLPEFRDQQINEQNTWRAASPIAHLATSEHDNAWNRFGSVQLPTLLQAVSDLNHRQIAAENNQDNLRVSAPVALRKLTRESNELRRQMALLSSQLESTQEQHRRELAEARQETASLLSKLDSVKTEHAAAIEQAVKCFREQSDQLVASTAHANNKVHSIEDSIAFAIQRIEFVRRELMFELRYGAGANGNDKALDASSEILSQEKLDAARHEALRVNLGCGHIALDGYINVDRRALPGVDIVAEVDSLPLGPGEVTEIFSSHLLEHFPEEQLRRQLLPYYNSLLKPGGTFRAVVPDAEAMIANYAQGNYPYEDMREVLYGSQDYDGDFHFNMFTPDSMARLLREAGFDEPTLVESGRKNGRCYEFEIIAKKQTVAVTAK